MIRTKFFIESDEKFGISMNAEDGLRFFAPRLLLKDVDKKNDFEQLKTLKKFISILKGYANSKSEEISFFRKEQQSTSFDIIEAYLNIINDYIENGSFIIFSKKSKKDRNNINWSRTIRDNDVIMQGNKILYGSFSSNTREVDNDDYFFKIYMNCLNDAQQLFLNSSLSSESISLNKQEAIYYINKYLDSHYKDREMYIAKQLKIIYSERNFSSVNEDSFSIKYHEYFEYVFQFLVEANIKKYSIKKNSDFFTNRWKGVYRERDSDRKTNGLDLRYDHLIEKENIYYILDSKFYINYNFSDRPSNFPLTADIVKQVGYKLYFSKIFDVDISKIESVFIFPKTDAYDKNIKSLYFADHLVENDLNNIFKIKCIFIDIENLIDNYIAGKPCEEIMEAISIN